MAISPPAHVNGQAQQLQYFYDPSPKCWYFDSPSWNPHSTQALSIECMTSYPIMPPRTCIRFADHGFPTFMETISVLCSVLHPPHAALKGPGLSPSITEPMKS